MESKYERKVLRDTITIYQVLSTRKWQQQVTPAFEADEVIVRQVTYRDAAAPELDNSSWALQTDLVQGDGIIATFTNPTTSNPGATFKLLKKPGATVRFSVQDVIAGPALRDTTADLQGILLVTLEFVKYA